MLMGIEQPGMPREISIESIESIIKSLGGRVSRVEFKRGELVVYTTGKIDNKFLQEVLRSTFLTCSRVVSTKREDCVV